MRKNPKGFVRHLAQILPKIPDILYYEIHVWRLISIPAQTNYPYNHPQNQALANDSN